MKTLDEFQKKGYTVVKNVVSKELCDFVTQYALFNEMQDFTAGDEQTPAAHSKYADPAMETTLLQLQATIEESTKLELYPTYSYFRVYRNKDELKPHLDRPSCEISVTLCFNYNYQNYSWPIFMNGFPVVLEPGDLVIYRGLDVKHWRLPLSVEEDVWHIQGFFHYVDVNGPHSEWKWDKRGSIGESLYVTSQKPYIQVVRH